LGVKTFHAQHEEITTAFDLKFFKTNAALGLERTIDGVSNLDRVVLVVNFAAYQGIIPYVSEG